MTLHMTLERGGGLGKGGPLCQLPRAQMPIPLPSPSSGSAHHPRPSQAPFPKLLIPISQRLFLRERHHTAPSTPLSGNSANQAGSSSSKQASRLLWPGCPRAPGPLWAPVRSGSEAGESGEGRPNPGQLSKARAAPNCWETAPRPLTTTQVL